MSNQRAGWVMCSATWLERSPVTVVSAITPKTKLVGQSLKLRHSVYFLSELTLCKMASWYVWVIDWGLRIQKSYGYERRRRVGLFDELIWRFFSVGANPGAWWPWLNALRGGRRVYAVLASPKLLLPLARPRTCCFKYFRRTQQQRTYLGQCRYATESGRVTVQLQLVLIIQKIMTWNSVTVKKTL